MDFESPDVAKEFPGLYASESMKRTQSYGSDYSDGEKSSKKDKEKKKERKESKKDKGYVAFEEESSENDSKSPGKSKKNKLSSFKFRGVDRKDKSNKSKDKELKDKKEGKDKVSKKDSKETKESKNDNKAPSKKKKSKLLTIKDKKKKNSKDFKHEKPVFGVPLHFAVERSKSHDGIELPVVVRECIDYIEEHGLSCEGIYRISGLKSKVRQLKSQYNNGEKVYLYEYEPHIVANLLKDFLHDLPEPILTSELTPFFEEAAVIKNSQKRLEILRDLINQLPTCNRVLLSWIIVHMLHVADLEKRNKMNLQNIPIILSPTLKINHYILHAFFAHSKVLFKGVELKRYMPPVELDSTRLSWELPDSPFSIAEELSKQENVLNILHGELNAGLHDKKKEEELWEIQRNVTQLKRKLRYLNHIKNTSVGRSNEVQDICSCDTKNKIHSLSTLSKAVLDKIKSEYLSSASGENVEVEHSKSDTSAKYFERAITDLVSINQNKNSILRPLTITPHLEDEKLSSMSNAMKISPPITSKSDEALTQDTLLKTRILNTSLYNSDSGISFSETKSNLSEIESSTVDAPVESENSVVKEDKLSDDNNHSIIHKESKSESIKNVNELSSLVESMIKTCSNEDFINKISKYIVCKNNNCSPPEFKEDEEKYFAAQLYVNILGDELILLRNDLKRKKNSEVFEIERLKHEINESLHLLKYKQYSFDSAPLLISSSSSTENSLSNSEHSSASDYDEDECDPYSILEELIEENKQLKIKSQEFLKSIEKEREKNVNVKVLMKMLQTVRRLKSSST